MNDILFSPGSVLRATVDAKAFSATMKKVGAVVPKNSVIPALNGVCVRFTGGRCTLTGTDLTTWILAEIPASGDDFAFVFSKCRDVERACRYFEGDVTLELSKPNDSPSSIGLVTVTCGPRFGEFEAYPIEDYPDTPELAGELLFSTNAAALLERINRVAYATRRSGQDTREISSCVEFSGSKIYAVDGYRAAWDTDHTLAFPHPFLVQSEQIRLLKLFGDAQVDFYFSSSRLYVTDGSRTLILRMTEDKPFNLKSAIPQKYMDEFSVAPKQLLRELKYLNAVSPKTKTPYVHLQENSLSMTVNGRRYSTLIDIHRRSSLLLCFNLRYMADALKQFAKEPLVNIKISGPNTPVVIEAEGRNDCAMVLPVRLNKIAAA